MQRATERKYQRKRFLINKAFQHRIMWHFIIIVAISILFSHIISVGFMKLKEIINPASKDLIYFANATQETLVFSRVLDTLWLPLIISAVVGIILVLIFGLFYSHRIAGPLFNLKQKMQQVGEGELEVSMKIRRNDEFHDVEEVFNQMVKGLRSRFGSPKKK